MTRLLGISEDHLYEHVVNWAEKFGFTIDQEVVDFGGRAKDDFIAELDQALRPATRRRNAVSNIKLFDSGLIPINSNRD